VQRENPNHHQLHGMPSMTLKQWRSLEELAGTPEFREALEREFPGGASQLDDAMSRRRFLALMGASLALAGLTSCSRMPIEKLVPYVKQPENLVPGRSLYFASAECFCGFARGVVVESHEGRPTKIEGNPLHPASHGATDPLMQAAVLQLYDPDRSQTPLLKGSPTDRDRFIADLLERQVNWKRDRGAGLRFVIGHTTSPTLLDQAAKIAARFPSSRWCIHEPALNAAIPREILPIAESDVILSIDADFLGFGPASVRNTKQFQSRRNPEGKMLRLYVAESAPSLTGAQADHRFPLGPAALDRLPGQLETALAGQPPTDAPVWLAALARDLKANIGRALVVAGEFLPASLHEAARRINRSLGRETESMSFGFPASLVSLDELTEGMRSGYVDSLIILGSNPVYTSPGDVDFAGALARVPFTVHLGSHRDETGVNCLWHLPESHWLEAWSDAVAFDGTPGVIQPLIEPLYESFSAHELLALLAEEISSSSYDIVRKFWSGHLDENGWRRAVHDGIVPASRLVNAAASASAFPSRDGASGAMALIIRPDARMLDGRFANNAWLQELPKPFTKLVWDNAAHIAPATARRLGLHTGDIVELDRAGRRVEAPVWILPGMAEDCVLVHLGYGRSCAGRAGNGIGFDAFQMQTASEPWGGYGLQLHPTGRTHEFVTTQHHQVMDGRDLVRHADLEEYRRVPDFARRMGKAPGPEETLYPKIDYNGHAWGMTINLGSCIGCSACTIACQAENNIPVVGREQVAMNREMHWIRVDRWFDGDPEQPQILFEPVPCMQCEDAPCEVVCPVGATVHDSEGINAMVYNRCIGTRYCSNNCPYKVRRFNFLEYVDRTTPQLELQRNPNVTVRTRGVMEKCTYCVQRIEEAHITAQVAGRLLRDGDVVPACAQACPADAITFGDINDRDSRVSREKARSLNYGLLEELNTRPRTTYLAKVWNRNPEIGA
jgi:molybdopterin-containing oxidoreductase family iron-sulfur binding subunit